MPVSLLPKAKDAADVLPADVLHIFETARSLSGPSMLRLEGARGRLFAGPRRMTTLGMLRASVQIVHDAAENRPDLGGQRQGRLPEKTFWWYMDQLASLGFGISHVAVAAAVRTDVDPQHYARVVAPWLAAGLPMKIDGQPFRLDKMAVVPYETLVAAVEAAVVAFAAPPGATK